MQCLFVVVVGALSASAVLGLDERPAKELRPSTKGLSAELGLRASAGEVPHTRPKKSVSRGTVGWLPPGEDLAVAFSRGAARRARRRARAEHLLTAEVLVQVLAVCGMWRWWLWRRLEAH